MSKVNGSTEHHGGVSSESPHSAPEQGLVHAHECTECPAIFDCDGSEWKTERYGECLIDMCRRCRERLHSSPETADLMPVDYYEIANATRGQNE